MPIKTNLINNHSFGPQSCVFSFRPFAFIFKRILIENFVFQALKAISETDTVSEQARQAMANGDLERAQGLYSKYMTDLDSHLAPPYPDYYKIQQHIWKCIWMRYGNRVVRGKVPTAPSGNDFDTVD